MYSKFGSCLAPNDNKIIVVKENKSQLIVQNKERETILNIRVDGCLKFEGTQCDALLILEKTGCCSSTFPTLFTGNTKRNITI
ncbi:MAG: hypothetical protein GY754_14855 [bacterium]|nr:hypothetical protein [bacterium]